MKRWFLRSAWLLLAAVLAGCARKPPPSFSPDPAWRAGIERRFDLVALRSFVQETVNQRKTFNGIDLTTAKLGAGWEDLGHALTNGFWIFAEEEGDPEAFTLTYNFSPQPILVLRCRRLDRDRFSLEKIGASVGAEQLEGDRFFAPKP